jgi:hypothetical protein
MTFTQVLGNLFAQIANPGWFWLCNLDPVNYVTWGIRDATVGSWYPVGELDAVDSQGAGHPHLLKLSRYINKEMAGTGTHVGADIATLHFKANNAPCKIRICTFER